MRKNGWDIKKTRKSVVKFTCINSYSSPLCGNKEDDPLNFLDPNSLQTPVRVILWNCIKVTCSPLFYSSSF